MMDEDLSKLSPQELCSLAVRVAFEREGTKNPIQRTRLKKQLLKITEEHAKRIHKLLEGKYGTQ